MAMSEPKVRLTPRQIVRLAAVVPANNMAAIAEGYTDIDEATIKNQQYENKDSAEAFNREIMKFWINKNSATNEVQVSKVLFILKQIYVHICGHIVMAL